MSDRLVIAIAQLNPTVGDLAGNLERLREARADAARAGADLVVTSEMMVSGYPPEDLVLKPAFQEATEAAIAALAAESGDGGPALLAGAPWRDEGKLYNATLLLAEGEIKALRFKHHLPNYGVFDEKRVFAEGPMPGPIEFQGVRLGVMICEDMWEPDVVECLEETGAEILVVTNGSPFEVDKRDLRVNLAVARIVESGLPLIYVNQCGGQDELVFDGGSFVLNADRSLAARLPDWHPTVLATHWRRDDGGTWRCDQAECARPLDGLEAIYQALRVGLRDYLDKNRFPGVLLGLSGGIDSSLSAALAVDALGPERVRCVMMPSLYTSEISRRDAAACVELLGVESISVPIAPATEALAEMLRQAFADAPADATEENIQARVRGMILMALSNKFGHMLLTTGNKSEMSVGYATLYGDMAGGYSVLKDVYKTTVYALANWRNQHAPEGALGPAGRVIPERTITRPPSAELKPDQTDQDTLPPYDQLDDILECLVEGEMAFDEITARGHAAETVRKVQAMLYTAEYKRRQAPPGVKITHKSFGRERRYPITNRFRES